MSAIGEEGLVTEASSREATSSPVTVKESECILEDSAYGEALITQHITIDFTPNDDDNDFVQRKCVAFWEFINSRPELNHLCAIPDQYESSGVTEVQSELSQFKVVKPKPENQEKTAVSMLEFVEEKRLIDRAFEARIPKLYCEFDLMPYSNDTSRISKDSPLPSSSKPLKDKKQNKKSDKKSLPKLKTFCKNMQKWDVDHPKSMAPPGPPPILQADVKLI